MIINRADNRHPMHIINKPIVVIINATITISIIIAFVSEILIGVG